MTLERTARQMFAEPVKVLVGRVVDIGTTFIVVATDSGRTLYEVANPTSYRVDDRVRYAGDVLIGRVMAESELPVYSV